MCVLARTFIATRSWGATLPLLGVLPNKVVFRIPARQQGEIVWTVAANDREKDIRMAAQRISEAVNIRTDDHFVRVGVHGENAFRAGQVKLEAHHRPGGHQQGLFKHVAVADTCAPSFGVVVGVKLEADERHGAWAANARETVEFAWKSVEAHVPGADSPSHWGHGQDIRGVVLEHCVWSRASVVGNESVEIFNQRAPEA